MKFRLIIVCLLICVSTIAQVNQQPSTQILIRCDDIGMSHSVNMAAKQVLEKGFPVSMSVMVPCAWFTEAVDLLKQFSNVSVGIHLTLNAEWKNYRWGPVSGVHTVPSLTDSLGNFFPSRTLLFNNHPKLEEIETELRAQIVRAITAGLKIDYLDYHMGAAVQNLETRKIVEKLASEFKLTISRYYGEEDVEIGYFAAPADKLDTLLARTRSLKEGGIKLFVFHVGLDTPELAVMEDLNPFGPKEMSKHRSAEFEALISKPFQHFLQDKKFQLVNYKMLVAAKGLSAMKRPLVKD
jgi:hypothetical protein